MYQYQYYKEVAYMQEPSTRAKNMECFARKSVKLYCIRNNKQFKKELNNYLFESQK